MNYLSNDELERYWFQYKAEYEPHGLSLEQFCKTHKISYRAMDNWMRQIRSKVVPVEVEGMPSAEVDNPESQAKNAVDGGGGDARYVSCRHRNKQDRAKAKQGSSPESQPTSARIMVTIKATNGLSIFQKNLDYAGLRLLVERLEGIC